VLCTGCAAAKRPAQGSPRAGYCDACGWALRLDEGGNETPTLRATYPLAARCVAEATVVAALIARCKCDRFAPGRMGYEPDEKAARETPGPHHTPGHCMFWREHFEPIPKAAESPYAGLVYAVVGDRL